MRRAASGRARTTLSPFPGGQYHPAPGPVGARNPHENESSITFSDAIEPPVIRN